MQIIAIEIYFKLIKLYVKFTEDEYLFSVNLMAYIVFIFRSPESMNGQTRHSSNVTSDIHSKNYF